MEDNNESTSPVIERGITENSPLPENEIKDTSSMQDLSNLVGTDIDSKHSGKESQKKMLERHAEKKKEIPVFALYYSPDKEKSSYLLPDLSLMKRLQRNIEDPNRELENDSKALLYAKERQERLRLQTEKDYAQGDYVTVSVHTNDGEREISIPKEEFGNENIDTNRVIPAVLVSEHVLNRDVTLDSEEKENEIGRDIDEGIASEELAAHEKTMAEEKASEKNKKKSIFLQEYER